MSRPNVADKDKLGQILIDIPTDHKYKRPKEWRTMGTYIRGNWPLLRYDDPNVKDVFTEK